MAIFKCNTAHAASPRPSLKERTSALLSRTANVLHVQFPVPKFIVKHRARQADRHIARLFAEWHKTVWAWGEADALMAVAPLGSQEQKRTEEASRRAYRRESVARRKVANYTEAHTLRGLQMRAIAWVFNYGDCAADLDARVAESLAAVEADKPSSGFELFAFSIARDLIRMAEADPRGPRFPKFPPMPSEEARAERSAPEPRGDDIIPYGIAADGDETSIPTPSVHDGDGDDPEPEDEGREFADEGEDDPGSERYIAQAAQHDFQPWSETGEGWRPPSREEWDELAPTYLTALQAAFKLLCKSKDEFVQFLGELDDETGEAMWRCLTDTHKDFRGFQKVLDAAEARLIVAGSAHLVSKDREPGA